MVQKKWTQVRGPHAAKPSPRELPADISDWGGGGERKSKIVSLSLKKKRLFYIYWASLVAQTMKNSPAMQETWIQSLRWEDPMEEDVATHSSVFAWRLPMDRGAWRATVFGSQRVGHN